MHGRHLPFLSGQIADKKREYSIIVPPFGGKSNRFPRPAVIFRKNDKRRAGGPKVFGSLRAVYRAVRGATAPLHRASRARGASSTWKPTLPALTIMVSPARADWSNTVQYGFFMPRGLQPPRT